MAVKPRETKCPPSRRVVSPAIIGISGPCWLQRPRLMRLKNSLRVAALLSKQPITELVMVDEPGFSTPRITMHMCLRETAECTWSGTTPPAGIPAASGT
jgi:hypothetical protein